MRVLFVCSRNRRRSPTAERVAAEASGVEALSAGTAPDADLRVSLDLIQWADLICAMEARHARALRRDFGPHLGGTRVVTLGIPDDYAFMDPALVALITAPYFRAAITRTQDAWRRVVAGAAVAGIPAPAFSSSLSYYDGLRAERLPAALVQGQRDFFGAHTYRRVDKDGTFHTLWSGNRSEVSATDAH